MVVVALIDTCLLLCGFYTSRGVGDPSWYTKRMGALRRSVKGWMVSYGSELGKKVLSFLNFSRQIPRLLLGGRKEVAPGSNTRD